MVVVMIENVYPVTNKDEGVARRSRTLPRNIRACGQTGGVLPVYMEDYVGTYIRRLTESGFPECSAMVLVGQVMETEIGRCLFVKGAINANAICEGDCPVFGEEVWNEVYEKIRLYFPCDEVVGWCVAGPGFRMLREEVFLRAHIDNFADSEKIFCCYESLEKELSIRICEAGHFRVLPGYCIYYEKNEEMQSYMLEESAQERRIKQSKMQEASENLTESPEEIQKKREEKKSSFRKDIMQLAAIACIIVLIVSVMAGTDTLETLKESVYGIRAQIASNGTNASSGTAASDKSNASSEAGEGQDKEMLQENAKAGEEDDSEEFAFGDFDFLDAVNPTGDDVKTSGAEQQETAQEGQSKAEQQETAQAGQSKGEQQETAQAGQSKAEQQETAQAEQSKAEQEDDPDRIEEETVAVLSPSEYTRYIVKAGDTLAQVCKEVYGSVELLYYVCELNQLKDIDSIYVGQELILPKK